MLIPVTLFVAVAMALFSYSQNQGGPVAGCVFFAVLSVGVFIHVAKPMFQRINGALPEKFRR